MKKELFILIAFILGQVSNFLIFKGFLPDYYNSLEINNTILVPIVWVIVFIIIPTIIGALFEIAVLQVFDIKIQ